MEKQPVCLVIEDDADVCGLITLVLSRAGFQVRAVSSGGAGVAAAADTPLSLVTLDMGLPDMDGHEVAHALRALSPAPLLFLTGRAEEDDVFSGLASGAAAYLTKPFSPGTLRETALRLCPIPARAAARAQP